MVLKEGERGENLGANVGEHPHAFEGLKEFPFSSLHYIPPPLCCMVL